jgi:hypothetical protein
MFKCQNGDCNIRGDVIDFYKRMAAWKFSQYRSIWETAVFLREATLEGAFNLSIDELEDYYPKGRKRLTENDNAQFDDEYWAITKMERELKAMQPDQALIKKVARIVKPQAVGRFSVRAICAVLLEAYPDDSWMAASEVRESYQMQRKVDWLKDSRLCDQSYLFLMCFCEKRAQRRYRLDRQWAIIEFDGIGREYQLSLHLYVAKKFPRMPLQLVVDSQNKSLQAYYKLAGIARQEYFELFKLAKQLGCDPQTIRPELRCRMPNGWNHKTGSKQKIVWMSEKFQTKLEGSERKKHKDL